MALIAHWPLNGNLYDNSGNNLTLSGTPSYGVGNLGKNSLSVTSLAEHVYLPASSVDMGRIFSNSYTVSFWYCPDNVDTTWSVLCSCGTSTPADTEFHCAVLGTNQMRNDFHGTRCEIYDYTLTINK